MLNPSTGDWFRDGTFALMGMQIVPSLNLNLMLQGRVWFSWAESDSHCSGMKFNYDIWWWRPSLNWTAPVNPSWYIYFPVISHWIKSHPMDSGFPVISHWGKSHPMNLGFPMISHSHWIKSHPVNSGFPVISYWIKSHHESSCLPWFHIELNHILWIQGFLWFPIELNHIPWVQVFPWFLLNWITSCEFRFSHDFYWMESHPVSSGFPMISYWINHILRMITSPQVSTLFQHACMLRELPGHFWSVPGICEEDP